MLRCKKASPARTGGEDLLEEQDVDIMAWAIGTAECPARYQGSIVDALKTLNYVPIAE